MKILETGLGVAMTIGVMGFAGCDVFVTGHDHHNSGYVAVQSQPVYAQPQPVYVQQQPQYVQPQPQYIVVQQAPPPLIVEQQPPPPPGYQVWIGGSWNWSNQRYVWQSGRYAVPPHQGSVWVAARYDRDEHGYRYSPGQWQQQNNGHDHDTH